MATNRNVFGSKPPTGMDHRQRLRGDCSSCQGLCCVSLSFDRSPWFSFDKPANVPCPHLAPTHRCRLHRRLDAAGHAGCASYDCYGAGQRVTQELFPGVDWRGDNETARVMFEAFRRLRDVHELRLLLHETERLPLSAADVELRAQLLTKLEPCAGFDVATLATLDLDALDRAVRGYLQGLRRHVLPTLGVRRRLPLLGQLSANACRAPSRRSSS